MTIEELTQENETLKSLIAEADTLKAETDKTLSDLTAERDSLMEELNALREKHEKQSEELAETKKLNFTLGRTIGSGKTVTENADESLQELFKELR